MTVSLFICLTVYRHGSRSLVWLGVTRHCVFFVWVYMTVSLFICLAVYRHGSRSLVWLRVTRLCLSMEFRQIWTCTMCSHFKKPWVQKPDWWKGYTHWVYRSVMYRCEYRFIQVLILVNTGNYEVHILKVIISEKLDWWKDYMHWVYRSVIISPDESRGYIGFRSVAPPPPPP